MKKKKKTKCALWNLVMTAALVLAWAVPAMAAVEVEPSPPEETGVDTVVLAWDAVEDPNVTGYRLYWVKGSAPGPFTHYMQVAERTTARVVLREEGTFTFVCTAVTADGIESLPSNAVVYATKERPPSPGLRIVSATATRSATVTTTTNVVLVPESP